MKKICCLVLFSCLFFVQNIKAETQAHRIIERTGDIFQFLPLAAAIYALSIKDYEGIKELAIGFGSTMGAVLISKQVLHAISKRDSNLVQFAKRPNGSNFQGFPSGHTASAFSAVGFLQKRYGWKLALPAAILASFVGYSRILAQKHTPFQVVAGAMLGFSVSYLVSSKYIDPSKHTISFDSTDDIRGRAKYAVRYSYFF
ncbi:phosphatase PAP2 family protein [Helicobacter sp. faydin-H17]|nr:phosphatase PAP2 family protein [Helicobacter kayseriensis]